MRCNLCHGVSYGYYSKTSDDVTNRMYRCKKCGNVFGTIEVKQKLKGAFYRSYFGEPIRKISCNDCIHINITEQEQLVTTGHCIPGHICTYYGSRVRHESNSLKFNTYINPCDRCINDNCANFRDRRAASFDLNDLCVEAEYIADDVGIRIKNNPVWGKELDNKED